MNAWDLWGIKMGKMWGWEKMKIMCKTFAELRVSYQCCWGLMTSGMWHFADWVVLDVLKHCDPWHSIIFWNNWMHTKSYFLHILGLILLPVAVALSSAWSVPFLACMRRWIMSGLTMPLSSRTEMVLCTSDRKEFTTELGMNLMWSSCVHETENKYYKWHNILNTNSCLCHTY